MATENPVGAVLVTSGNASPLAAGSRETALAPGQIGIFNAHTGLSVDGTVADTCKDIYLAVGINRTGAGGGATLEDIARSSGQVIQVRNMRAYTAKPYISPLAKIVDITSFDAKCETEYVIKVEVRNQKAYMINGYNAVAKVFSFVTGCCTQQDCTACPDGDGTELSVGLAARINADVDALMTASLFVNKVTATLNTAATADGTATFKIGDDTFTADLLDLDTATQSAVKIAAALNAATGLSWVAATPTTAVMNFYPKKSVSTSTATFAVTAAGGTGITVNAVATSNVAVTDVPAFKIAVPGAIPSIKITAADDTAPVFNGNIPIKYDNPRGTNLIVSLLEGFVCNGTVTTAQELRYEEGNYIDVQAEEYEAGGFTGKPGPYRTSALLGLQKPGFEYLAIKGKSYAVFTLTYGQQSVGGWETYTNNLQTRIFTPCDDATTVADMITMFDRIFTQFGGMAGDVGSNFDCTNTAVNVIDNYATDGIESLTS